jgi:hypothetical protein
MVHAAFATRRKRKTRPYRASRDPLPEQLASGAPSQRNDGIVSNKSGSLRFRITSGRTCCECALHTGRQRRSEGRQRGATKPLGGNIYETLPECHNAEDKALRKPRNECSGGTGSDRV